MQKIQSTRNYTRFIVEHFNREIVKINLLAIMESMKANGFRDSGAILVQADPKNPSRLIVVDGHHRFLAAQSIGLPIKYRVLAKGANPMQELLDHEIISRRWSMKAFLEFHAYKAGVDDYAELLTYNKEYGIAHSSAARLFNGGVGGTRMTKSLKQGTWRITDRDLPLRVGKIVKTIAGWHSRVFAARTGLVTAIASLCAVSFFDDTTMMSQIDKHARLLLPVSTTEFNLDQLDKIYNKRRGVMALPLSETAASVMRQRRRYKNDRSKYHEFDILRVEAE